MFADWLHLMSAEHVIGQMSNVTCEHKAGGIRKFTKGAGNVHGKQLSAALVTKSAVFPASHFSLLPFLALWL
jgi:hypothetical protein